MSARLRVEELRAELQRRGLDASGNKPVLVRRLDAAIRKEEEEEAAVSAAAKEEADAGGVVDGEGNGEDKRKRKRRGDGEDVDNSESDAAKLEGMSYRELQALAKSRGLAANGSKKEVIERLLCAPSDTDGGVQDKKKIAKDGDDRVEECRKEKIVTATRKGAAVLDQHIPDHIKMTYHVLQVGDEIYDATMNQTNIGDNNNKFYIIQALGYNADKLPLGKLSKSTIFKVEALGEIEIATKLLEDDSTDQVALGEMNELLNADYDANNLPKGKLRSVSNVILLISP
uniref:NAD(+) ADP-ribosyltransferase n=1 Tax=Oryza nivara TaxID=4536 RepID=A0A0E0FLD8_ORYNI